MYVTIMYDGHLQEDVDDAIEAIAKRYGGSVTGSGYGFQTNKRDVGVSIASKQFEKFKKAILRRFKKAKVTID